MPLRTIRRSCRCCRRSPPTASCWPHPPPRWPAPRPPLKHESVCHSETLVGTRGGGTVGRMPRFSASGSHLKPWRRSWADADAGSSGLTVPDASPASASERAAGNRADLDASPRPGAAQLASPPVCGRCWNGVDLALCCLSVLAWYVVCRMRSQTPQRQMHATSVATETCRYIQDVRATHISERVDMRDAATPN